MIVVACVAIIAGGWIAIGAIAWLAQILLRVIATITVAAWHLFEGTSGGIASSDRGTEVSEVLS